MNSQISNENSDTIVFKDEAAEKREPLTPESIYNRFYELGKRHGYHLGYIDGILHKPKEYVFEDLPFEDLEETPF